MKWTFDWLKDYLKTNMSAREIADVLTHTGLEIESIAVSKPVIAAKIVESKPLPGSDHLHILKVDSGDANLRQVVCGAPNARKGLVSALAIPGCIIEGHEIQDSKIRGVLSDGMMCSEKELGLGNDHSGIIELPKNTKIGSKIVGGEIVFDADITPNRPDYLSVRGIALDLAGCGVGKYIKPKDIVLSPIKSSRRVEIKTDKCLVYQFCEVEGLQAKPSDKKMKSRLIAIGINPKNVLIDTTNYICYDMGQPLHCFDADNVQGDIIVRNAKEGEKFTDLFGAEHILKKTDVVIADKIGILALAGIIGAKRAMTTDSTKNIILESAYFDPVSVRKSSKRLGISTDASYRYERGIDPTISGIALAAAVQIIMKTCGGKIKAVGVDGKIPAKKVSINYTPDLFKKKTGINLSLIKQREILEKLGNKIQIKGKKWIITPLSSRVDITIPENIVSEVLRVYGYDKIIKSAVRKPTFVIPHNDYNMELKSRLAARGLNETISFGFGNSEIEKLISDKKIIKIINPITNDMNTARNGLIGNLLKIVSENEKRGFSDLNLFEIGSVFDGGISGQQHIQLAIIRMGNNSPKHWQKHNRGRDIYDVKADLISLLENQKFTVSPENPPLWAHPFRYGAILIGNKKIAEFGELNPLVARKLKIKTNVFIALVDDIKNLPERRKIIEPNISEFQPITRDFAFIIDEKFPAEKLIKTAKAVDDRITDIVVFDSFEMGNSKKSVAFTITITPRENMTDSDLLEIQNKIIKKVETKCNAKIRDR